MSVLSIPMRDLVARYARLGLRGGLYEFDRPVLRGGDIALTQAAAIEEE